MSIPYDRVVARERAGIYESHYLKANSPDGERGLWIKHTLMRPLEAAAVAELWFVWFERGRPPRVVRSDVPWERLGFGDGPRLDAGPVSLSSTRAQGELAGIRWDLALSGAAPPILTYPWSIFYKGPFPNKKTLTPAPNLRFNGAVQLDGRRLEIGEWIGLRGHNWGTEHAYSYGFGTCNLWDDGVERSIDGASARIRLAGRPSPLLTVLCVRAPEGDRDLNRPWQWLRHGRVEPMSWQVRRPHTHLVMRTVPEHMVGLRYNQPAGGEQYCYNTKFAQVSLRLGSAQLSSRCGELETFFPEPLPDIPLHPPASWTARKGVYDSAA